MNETRHLTDLALDRWVETAATAGPDAAVSAHLERCTLCRETAQRLRHLLDTVARAPRAIESPEDGWPALRSHIETRQNSVRLGPPPRVLPFDRGSQIRWRVAAAAAAVLIVVSAGIDARLLQRRGGPPSAILASESGAPAQPSSSSNSSQPVTAEAPTESERRLERELLAELELRRGELRPETAARVDESLRVLDRAIGEITVALERDPRNHLLRQLLAATRERKVELLRQTANAS
ncbi:MAG: hypothetical protein NVS4B3_06590 [Gemmatimonadaceae bacterium]